MYCAIVHAEICRPINHMAACAVGVSPQVSRSFHQFWGTCEMYRPTRPSSLWRGPFHRHFLIGVQNIKGGDNVRNPKHSPSSRARESISFPNTRSHSTMSVRRRWLRTPRPGTGEGEIGAERHKMASACPLLHTTPCGSSYQGSYKKLPARSQPRCRCQATQQPMATVSASFQSTTQSAHPTSLAPLSNMPDKPVLRHTGRTEEPVNHRTLRGRRGGLSLSRMRGQRSTYARVGFGSLCD